MPGNRPKLAYRLTAIYLIFGLAWILLTDFLVNAMVDGDSGSIYQTYKGTVFVLLSALLLFLFVRHEVASRQSTRQRLRLIESAITHINEGVVITGPHLDAGDPVVEYVNPAMVRITGYSREELIGSTPQLLMGERSDASMLEQYLDDLKSGRVAAGQTVNYRKDGTSYIAEWQTVPLYDESGAITHYVSTHRDVTRRKEAEDRLRENEQRFRSLFDMNPDGVFGLDLEGRMESLNPAAISMFEYSPDEVLGKSFAELVAPDAEDDARERFQRVVSGESLYYDTFYINQHGERLDIEGLALPIVIDGTVTGIFGMMKDVTRRNRSEQQLRTQIRRLDALHAIDRAITTGSNLSATLHIVLDEIVKLLQADAGAIAITTAQDNQLRYVAINGFAGNQGLPSDVIDSANRGTALRATQMMRIISDIEDERSDLLSPELADGQSFRKYISAPLIARGHAQGVIELFFSEKDFEPDLGWFDMLDSAATQAAIAIDNGSMFEGLQRSNIELSIAYETTLEGWARALEMRDDETEGHSQRVTAVTIALAREIGVSDVDLVHIRRGALLHDIGKMAIPDSILSKPGPLDEREWEIMRQHPEHARRMLEDIPFLRDAIDIPYLHHERWDGSGYPLGLKGDAIPLAARIFAVADVWDALLSDRPYRRAWDEEAVREHIRNGAGSHFDPQVVDVFLSRFPSVARRSP